MQSHQYNLAKINFAAFPIIELEGSIGCIIFPLIPSKQENSHSLMKCLFVVIGQFLGFIGKNFDMSSQSPLQSIIVVEMMIVIYFCNSSNPQFRIPKPGFTVCLFSKCKILFGWIQWKRSCTLIYNARETLAVFSSTRGKIRFSPSPRWCLINRPASRLCY